MNIKLINLPGERNSTMKRRSTDTGRRNPTKTKKIGRSTEELCFGINTKSEGTGEGERKLEKPQSHVEYNNFSSKSNAPKPAEAIRALLKTR